MTDLATIRPDEWNIALFVHVLGAFALVGALVVAGSYLFLARRGGSIELVRAGYRSLWMAALPAYVIARVGAQWIASEEGLDDSDAAWIGLGYISTDAGLVLLLGATLAAGLALRRADGPTVSGRGVAIAAWIVALLVVVYAVVIWAMATKPV